MSVVIYALATVGAWACIARVARACRRGYARTVEEFRAKGTKDTVGS